MGKRGGSIRFVVALTVTFAAALLPSHAAQALQLCVMPSTAAPELAHHALHAFDAAVPRFGGAAALGGLSVAVLHAASTPSEVVSEFVANGSSCGMLIGPFRSPAAISVGPLLNGRLFVSPTASANSLTRTELSGFARVADADRQYGQAMAALLLHFGYRQASFVGVRDAYGRSVLESFSAAYSATGRLEKDDLLAAEYDTEAEADDAVRHALEELRTPAIVLGTTAGTTLHRRLVAELRRTGRDRQHVIVFSESACLAGDTADLVAGAFCVLKHVPDDAVQRYVTAFDARDVSAIDARLPPTIRAQVTTATIQRTKASLGALLTHDAVVAAIASVAATTAADRGNPRLVSRGLLRVNADGATGRIAFDEEGWRVGATFALVNVQADLALSTFATFSPDNETVTTLQPARFVNWLGRNSSVQPTPADFADLTTVALCYIYQNSGSATQSVLHANFTAQYYASRFRLAFRVEAIHDNATRTLADASAAIVQHQDDCDVLIGPPTSLVSTAVSSLVARPWVSDAASSTELSDKATHPWFSRVIPTDEVGGAAMAALLADFGYTRAALLCTDEPYGRSVTIGFSNAFAGHGGMVTTRDCLATTATDAQADAVLDRLGSRVVVLATLGSAPAHATLLRRIAARGLQRTHVLLLAESACSPQTAADPLFLVPGAFCVTFSINATLAAPYAAAFAARNRSDYAALVAAGFAPADDAGLSANSALTHDATLFAMAAVEDAVLRRGVDVTASAALLRAVRGFAGVEGLTGHVRMNNATGDRLSATILYKNVGLANATEEIGSYTNAAGVVRNRDRVLLWLGGTTASATAPTVDPAEPPADNSILSFDVPAYAIVVALAIGLSLFLVAFVIYRLHKLDPVAFGRVVSSGAIFSVAKFVFNFVDIAIDIAAAIAISGDEGIAELVRILYGVLTGIAGVASIVELAMLATAIRHSLWGKLDIDKAAALDRRMDYAELVTMCVEDIPMLVISGIVAATARDADVLVLAAAIISALMVGLKLSKIANVFWHMYTERTYEDNATRREAQDLTPEQRDTLIEALDAFLEFEREEVPDISASNAIANGHDDECGGAMKMRRKYPLSRDALLRAAQGEFKGSWADIAAEENGIVMKRVDAALKDLIVDPIEIESHQSCIEAFALIIELVYPHRFQHLRAAAEATAGDLTRGNISQNEFYAVVLPYLMLLYDKHDYSPELAEKPEKLDELPSLIGVRLPPRPGTGRHGSRSDAFGGGNSKQLVTEGVSSDDEDDGDSLNGYSVYDILRNRRESQLNAFASVPTVFDPNGGSLLDVTSEGQFMSGTYNHNAASPMRVAVAAAPLAAAPSAEAAGAPPHRSPGLSSEKSHGGASEAMEAPLEPQQRVTTADGQRATGAQLRLGKVRRRSSEAAAPPTLRTDTSFAAGARNDASPHGGLHHAPSLVMASPGGGARPVPIVRAPRPLGTAPKVKDLGRRMSKAVRVSARRQEMDVLELMEDEDVDELQSFPPPTARRQSQPQPQPQTQQQQPQPKRTPPSLRGNTSSGSGAPALDVSDAMLRQDTSEVLSPANRMHRTETLTRLKGAYGMRGQIAMSIAARLNRNAKGVSPRAIASANAPSRFPPPMNASGALSDSERPQRSPGLAAGGSATARAAGGRDESAMVALPPRASAAAAGNATTDAAPRDGFTSASESPQEHAVAPPAASPNAGMSPAPRSLEDRALRSRSPEAFDRTHTPRSRAPV